MCERKGMRHLIFAVVLSVIASAFTACSTGPESLLEDGATAMESLMTESKLNVPVVRKGIASLEAFIEQSPYHAHADSALFMLATLQEVTGKHRDAAQNYLRILRSYPESEFRARGLILAGHIYENMGDINRSKAAYERLIEEFPEHEFVSGGSAQWLLDNLGRPSEEWPVPFGEPGGETPGHADAQ